MVAVADLLDLVPRADLEFYATPVDFGDFGNRRHIVTDRCRGEMSDIHRGSNRALTHLQILSDRIERGIFDPKEFKKALAWVKDNCREGLDVNQSPRSREAKDQEWEMCVKMTMIARDLMIGNPRLAELGFGEEHFRTNLILALFIGLEEYSQRFFPARTADIFDFLASCAGVTFFAWLAYRLKR
jgi:hypothetical protein